MTVLKLHLICCVGKIGILPLDLLGYTESRLILFYFSFPGVWISQGLQWLVVLYHVNICKKQSFASCFRLPKQTHPVHAVNSFFELVPAFLLNKDIQVLPHPPVLGGHWDLCYIALLKHTSNLQGHPSVQPCHSTPKFPAPRCCFLVIQQSLQSHQYLIASMLSMSKPLRRASPAYHQALQFCSQIRQKLSGRLWKSHLNWRHFNAAHIITSP